MAMEEALPTSALSGSQLQRDINHCRRQIAEIERELRAGNPDVHGLCLGLKDWSAELGILERERQRRRWLRPAASGCGLLATVLGLALRDPAILEPPLVIGADETKVEAGEGVRQPAVGRVERIVLLLAAEQFLEDVRLGANGLVQYRPDRADHAILPIRVDPEGDAGAGVLGCVLYGAWQA
jgi:hypothetical protein